MNISEGVVQSHSHLNVNNIQKNRLPGDLAMWFFILAELTVFAIFFIGFAVTEQLNLEMFAQGKEKLHKIAGLVNTLTLITSSFMVALALFATHEKKGKLSTNYLISGIFFAVIYLVVKSWEYLNLFAQDIDIETNTFFTLYFLITFFHYMHILLGVVILSYMAKKSYSGAYQTASENVSGFEAGASYWHMVDLVWIILFPLLYII